MNVSAVIVAAGSGSRLGADVPKAFVQVEGRTLVQLCVDRFLAHPLVSDVVVVAPESHRAVLAASVSRDVRVVAGAGERADSVRCGLAALTEGCDVVLVHDAARPFVPAEVITRVVDAIRDGADGVIPVLAVTDTIKRVDAAGMVVETVPRTELRAVQTPQGFRRDLLDRAHETGQDATDDAGLIEALGGKVVTVAGADEGFKITTPFDLAVAQALSGQGVLT